METSVSTQPLVILNPVANGGKMQRYRSLMQRYLTQDQALYRETTRAGDAQAWAAEAALEGRPLVVVGGDGTVHEAANGILGSGERVPLGIVPAGSGNDYAWRTLKLPHDPEEALAVAFSEHVRPMDVGKVNGRYFVNSFSVGLDADIADAANHLKNYPLMSGERLYYIASLRQLFFGYQRCPWLRFQIDTLGEDFSAEKRFVLLAVTLGPAYGGGFYINPQADPTDGFFDICAVRYMPLLRAVRLLPVMQKGKHTSLPEVMFSRARALVLESRLPVMMEADGETSLAQHFEVQLLPAALRIRMSSS